MRRLLSIELHHTPDGWVWADHGGWGAGVHKWWLRALLSALKGTR